MSVIILLLLLAKNVLWVSTETVNSLVVTSPEEPINQELIKEENYLTKYHHHHAINVPQIYQMRVISNIHNRYANTTITSKVRNFALKAQEATFTVVLPETAFISGFVMEVGGKNYTAYVKEKEQAKKDYDHAVASGQGAAHVAVSARDSNRFTVSVNIEPHTKAAFYLVYEQLLKRQESRYEQVINIHPGQPVKNLNVEVVIRETRKIVDLRAPPLRSGNEIGTDKPQLDPRANINIVDEKTAIITFSPDLERQKELAHSMGTKESEGLAGQFVVQYDVERDPQGGEVLIQDGYFVHFFAPSELKPLPKHVVFVLDTSGSMYGQKILQLKEAMLKILEQLHENDLFTLVEFNTYVKVWDINNPQASVHYPNTIKYYRPGYYAEVSFENYTFPNAYSASSENIQKAKYIVSLLQPTGATNIHSALKVGLHLVDLAKSQEADGVDRQPILIFLTDGAPTVGIISRDAIVKDTTNFNVDARKSPIFALSFGRGAEKGFLKQLALRNNGFQRHIYEAADASLQLQDFYKQISSPLLSNVTFKYEPSVTSLTKTEFPVYFRGSEFVVCGRYVRENEFGEPTIDARGTSGRVMLRPSPVTTTISNIERLWAYLTIKQLLERQELDDSNIQKVKQKALDLALRYSFVTPVSSLIVVRPNAANAIETQSANSETSRQGGYAQRGSAGKYSRGGGGGASNAGGGASRAGGGMAGKTSSDAGSGGMTNSGTMAKSSSAGEVSKKTDLFTKLPWLKDMLDANGNLVLPSGNYKLGLNQYFNDNTACDNSPPNNGTGHCSLIHACPKAHPFLVNATALTQHYCILRNEYAGVCCPSSS